MKWLQSHEYIGNWVEHVVAVVVAIPLLNKLVWIPTRKVLGTATVACANGAASLAIVCGGYLMLAGFCVWARFNQEAAKELAKVMVIVCIAYYLCKAFKEATPKVQQSWPDC